jgi:glycine/D-amino acid oxidase-like deaminating enzyme
MSTSTRSIAVIGGGFAGLSAAYQLSPHASRITVFDVLPPGQAGASAAAGGLLHPLASRGVPIWKGVEGFDAALQQLRDVQAIANEVKQKTDGDSVFFEENVRILRPLFKSSDCVSWRKASQTTSQSWLKELEVSEYVAAHPTGCQQAEEDKEKKLLGVMAIQPAVVVQPERYLSALWTAVRQQCHDSSWCSESIDDTERVFQLHREYDVVVLAPGPFLQQLWSNQAAHQFFVKYVKGQNLLFSNGDRQQCITSRPLLSGEYVVPRWSPEWGSYLICGATHEHLHAPSLDTVRALMTTTRLGIDGEDSKLRSRLETICPALHSLATPFAITAGIRLVTRRTELGKIPIVGRHPVLPNVWAIGGFGARGLVYHALMAKYLSEAILDDNEDCIPKALRPQTHYMKMS